MLALGNRLSMGVEPACILLQGDSTGNGTNEWFYQTMQWLAKQYPAYTFMYRLWSDANQSYDGSTTIQTGSSGDAYAVLPGTSGSYISAPDTAALDITGDIDIRVKVALDTWVVGSGEQTLISKFGGAPNRSWRLVLKGSNGRPFFQWSADGTNLLGGPGTYTEATSDIPATNGNAIWIRVTLDVDNGSGGHTIKFYTSQDGATWTQLGTDRVGSGTTSIFANNNAVEIGSRNTGTIDLWPGKVYAAEIRNGINGKVVASPDLDMAFPAGVTSFKDAEGNVWTVNGSVTVGNGSPGVLILNSSAPGQAISYSTNPTRFDLQTPIEPILAFISYGHNQGATVSGWQSTYEGLASQLRTKYPNVGVVCVTQNPRKSPASNITPHAQRNNIIAVLAAKNGFGLVDVYRAFMETGNPDAFVDVDGIHPNQAGSDLWRDVAINFLRPATLLN